jgi:hypothetical protein
MNQSQEFQEGKVAGLHEAILIATKYLLENTKVIIELRQRLREFQRRLYESRTS